MRFYNIPSKLEEEINKYEKLVNDYIAGTIAEEEIKPFRVPMGVYEQRDGKYMMRIRLAGGAISPNQLMELGKISKEYTDWELHITTRQDIQIHGLELIDTVKIYRELKKIGITSRGGGGNAVRNIVSSHYAGIDADEVFDVSPYVRALTSRLIAEDDSFTLPRKFKIAFSGSKKDLGLATLNDVGFIAKNENGKDGFSVYVAGGMGGSPRPSILYREFIEASDVYNIAFAAKTLFDKHGNRRNKNKARLRFLLDDLGKDSFIKVLDDEFDKVKAAGYKPLELPTIPKAKSGSFELSFFLGDISSDNAIKLAEILKPYGDDVIRFTNAQNMIIRNIDESKVSALKEEIFNKGITKEIPKIIGSSVACAGASTCKLGICLSRNLPTATLR